jgi:hypothetical protein
MQNKLKISKISTMNWIIKMIIQVSYIDEQHGPRTYRYWSFIGKDSFEKWMNGDESYKID